MQKSCLGIFLCMLAVLNSTPLGAASASSPESTPPQKSKAGKHLEDHPEIADKIQAAIDKIGKNKTGTLKIHNTAKGDPDSNASSTKKMQANNHPPKINTPNKLINEPLLEHAASWSYEGPSAPESWAKLTPENKLCENGQRQSPIHIQDAETLPLDGMEQLIFGYRPSSASIINNGHTLQVDIHGDNRLRVRGNEYRLIQFHFHHPAEERINYQNYEMVAHLVHRNSEGQLAVVAILFTIGTANPLLDTLWGNMPLEINDRVRWPGTAIDVNKLLPTDRRYYQFMGSLTTPPCSEGVLWMILKQPITISAPQLEIFSKLFPNNARPSQPTNGRIIKSAQ